MKKTIKTFVGRLTYCYDCKTEEDFDDLINMEVK